MRAIVAAILIAACPALVSAQSMTPQKVLLLPSTPPTLTETYGPGPQHVGELRLPSGKGPFPVAILVHGGCWQNKWAMDHFAPLASALTAKGYATWSIEYRRLGDAGAGWPGSFEDWAAAADHVRSLAKRYPLDLKRVITVGHSAGALGAVWIAARPNLPAGSPLRGKDPLRIKAAVNMDGPSELKPFAASGRDRQVCGAPVISQFMGGSPAEAPEHYALGDPGERLPLKTPQLVVASAVLSKADADSFAAKARAAGDPVEILDVTGTGHFDMIAPGTPAYARFEAFLVEKAPR
jgi:acetyl esterase/lipase